MANAASAFTLYRDALVGKTSFAVGRFEAVDSPQSLAERVKEGAGIDVTVVNPRLIVDELVLLVAANKAAHLDRQQKLKTGSIHTEVLYQLSCATNIASALETFGPANLGTPATVIVCVFNPTDDALEALCAHVGGRALPVTTAYGPLVDTDAVVALYKLQAVATDRAAMVDAIVTKLAIKQPS